MISDVKPADPSEASVVETPPLRTATDTESLRMQGQKKGKGLRNAKSSRIFRRLFLRAVGEPESEIEMEKVMSVEETKPISNRLEGQVQPESPEKEPVSSDLNTRTENANNLEYKRTQYNGKTWEGKVIVRASPNVRVFCKFKWIYLTEVQRGKFPKDEKIPRQFEDHQCFRALQDLARQFCGENESVGEILLLQDNGTLVVARPNSTLSDLLDQQPPFITINIITVALEIPLIPDKLEA